jgi:oxygen-dependent protoporphyrinogen oxidase
MRHAGMMKMGDYEVTLLVQRTLHQMLKLPDEAQASLVRIFRHEHAIPQYEQSSGARLAAVDDLQHTHPGLILAGNLRDGIGMADRIRQACAVAQSLS